MLLSALALAAALQAAPNAGQQGYVFNDNLSDTAQPIEKRTLPRVSQSIPWAIQAYPVRSSGRLAYKRPPMGFVRNPQMVNCKSTGPELVASSERLQALPLSKMPKARGERAVARLVDGCPVAVPIEPGPVER
jgi:hypothetical protein